jgi:hypothetical protein
LGCRFGPANQGQEHLVDDFDDRVLLDRLPGQQEFVLEQIRWQPDDSGAQVGGADLAARPRA